jgi:hypothetical protein
VPPDGAFASGTELAVIITLAPGSVTTTNGLQQSITITLAGGAASVIADVSTYDFASFLYWDEDPYTVWD